MKALIVEDELLARNNLRNLIMKLFDDIEIAGTLSSVKETIEWLSDPSHRTDVIFLDVELSDGMCFDIFEQVRTDAKIIITTAYDNYALQAFRISSIDYLLKPIDPDDLCAAVARCRTQKSPIGGLDVESLRKALSAESPAYKSRFVIRLGDRIVLLKVDDIAYFHAEDKSTYAVTFDGKRLILDMTLDAAQEAVDPRRFFRVSRSQIVSINAIETISKHLNNRLKINIRPKPDFEIFVSRFRIPDFLEWLEGK